MAHLTRFFDPDEGATNSPTRKSISKAAVANTTEPYTTSSKGRLASLGAAVASGFLRRISSVEPTKPKTCK
jgi:hypothetical protein